MMFKPSLSLFVLIVNWICKLIWVKIAIFCSCVMFLPGSLSLVCAAAQTVVLPSRLHCHKGECEQQSEGGARRGHVSWPAVLGNPRQAPLGKIIIFKLLF